MITQLPVTCLIAITFLMVPPARLTVIRTLVRPNSRVRLTSAQVSAARGAPCLNIRYLVVFMNSLADWRTTTGRQSAWAVRIGLQAAGLDMQEKPYYAKDYGPFLVHLGFSQIPNDSPPQPGDIMVLQPGPNPSGHVQVWNGSRWVSDFMQPANRAVNRDKRYRDIDVPYALYRYPKPCE